MWKPLITLNNLVDLNALRAIYKGSGPREVLGYQTLDNYISWFEKDQQQKHIKIYTLPKVWKKSGLYLIVDRYQLMVNALDTEEAVEELKIALPQLDWSRGYKLTGVPATHFKTILKILSDMGLHMNFIRLKVLSLQREEILKLDVNSLPPDFEFRPISLADAAIVNDIWYSRHNGTLEFIRRLITYNHNIGIYMKSTGELIAWCIRCNMGLLGMLHVKDAYRGRGFSKAIIQRLTRQLAETGNDAVTMLSDTNLISFELFKKLNFKEIGSTYIIWTKRYENSEIWSDELEAKEC